jgi:hypothetical protein
MAATTPVGFDPDPQHLGLTLKLKAGEKILAGQIVAFEATGVSRQVVKATNATGQPIGIAAHEIASGAEGTILSIGCVCKVELSADDGTADAGDWIGVSTVAGTGIVRDPAILAHDAVVGLQQAVGIALEDIAAGAATVGGKGYILIMLSPPVAAAS